MTARAQLRSGTRDAHEALDTHFSAYDLSRPADYGRFLAKHAAAFIPVEQALTRAGAARLFPQWPDMIRAQWLASDLARLEIPLPPPVAPPTFDSDAAICGGIYVLEGSRLGAAVLRKSIGAGFPVDYIAHDPSHRWLEIIAQIERILEDDVDRSRAIAAANAVFACFLRALPQIDLVGHERDE